MQDYSATVTSPSRPRSMTLFVAVIAFILGAGLVAWASVEGYLGRLLPVPEAQQSEPADPSALVTEAPVSEDVEPMTATQQMVAIGSVEGRLALLEDRLSRIDFQTDAAWGNAARAEGLLIAFAARRMVERGEPLSYVADQLRLRFMNAQPRAVQTIIAFSQEPVTLDELSARLEALSPELSKRAPEASLWERASHEVTSLFVVRRDSSALMTPSARIDRARVMLTARRIGKAIGEVERLPGAEAAETWIADARRYADVQHALDLLETTAMLEPNRLKDAEGHKVDQPSPLATPAATPTPAPTPAPARKPGA